MCLGSSNFLAVNCGELRLHLLLRARIADPQAEYAYTTQPLQSMILVKDQSLEASIPVNYRRVAGACDHATWQYARITEK